MFAKPTINSMFYWGKVAPLCVSVSLRKSHILRTCCNLAVNIYSRQQLSTQGYSPKANILY